MVQLASKRGLRRHPVCLAVQERFKALAHLSVLLFTLLRRGIQRKRSEVHSVLLVMNST
jgi:hypothetical protein